MYCKQMTNILLIKIDLINFINNNIKMKNSSFMSFKNIILKTSSM